MLLALAVKGDEESTMSKFTKSPFDKEPAEGSRDIVERELARQERRTDRQEHAPNESAAPQKKDGDHSRTENRDKSRSGPA
jgi:hypothetical protein